MQVRVTYHFQTFPLCHCVCLRVLSTLMFFVVAGLSTAPIPANVCTLSIETLPICVREACDPIAPLCAVILGTISS
jgi:hypothetical protein